MNTERLKSEQGAIFVFVGLAILVLVAFLVFVIDHGILNVARGQAQNAADAGALAGAVGRAYDDLSSPPPSTGVVANAAINAAQANQIWDAPGVAQVSWTCPTGVTGSCVRVDVYRNGQFGSTTLPTIFGPVLSIMSQRVRATATAHVASGNASDCLKPFAIPDLYQENSSPANEDFNAGVDTYTNPGYTLANSLGTELLLKGGSDTRMAPGWFRLLDIIGGGSGGTSELRRAIRSCATDVYGIGDDLTSHLENGVSTGSLHGVDDLIDLDPMAYYDSTTQTVVSPCVQANNCQRYPVDHHNSSPVPDPGRTYSPRVVPLAIFNPEIQAAAGNRVVITNILGFFVLEEGVNAGRHEVRGIIVSQPGLVRATNGSVGAGSAFLRVIRLIR